MSKEITDFSACINNIFLSENRVFCLMVDKALKVQAWQGEGEYYGFNELQQGRDLSDELPYMVGLPADESFIRLDFVMTAGNHHAHILISNYEQSWGIAYLDAGQEAEGLRHQQQRANNLGLEMELKDQQLAELKKNLQQLHKRIQK